MLLRRRDRPRQCRHRSGFALRRVALLQRVKKRTVHRLPPPAHFRGCAPVIREIAPGLPPASSGGARRSRLLSKGGARSLRNNLGLVRLCISSIATALEGGGVSGFFMHMRRIRDWLP